MHGAAEEPVGRPAGFRHDVAFYASPDELVAVAVPFLEAALAAGEAAVIAATPPTTAVLREALDADDEVLVLERHAIYRERTPSAITAFRQLTARRTGDGFPAVRVVGETDFGRTPRDWQEWERYEAVINEAFAPCPLWGLCLYDTGQLPAQVLESGRRVHPYLRDASGRRRNPDFADPAEFVTSLPLLPEPLEDQPPALAVQDVEDFIGLRHSVAAELGRLAAPRDVVEDLLLAIDEMSSNAVRHGAPPVTLRLWTSAERVVCRISDRGPGLEDPFAGYGPAHGDDLSRGGMGLWLARQLCDNVDVIDDGGGLTVRLATSLR